MPIRDFFLIVLSHIIVQKDVFVCLKIVPPHFIEFNIGNIKAIFVFTF